MDYLTEHSIQCPFCWENIQITIDNSVDSQEYIEDCQVCCNPINMVITHLSDSSVHIELEQAD